MRFLRSMVFAALALSASPALAVNITAFDMSATPTFVTDVSTTNIPGVVIYDAVIPFSVGTFTPADPLTGTPAEGGNISGGLQSRVVKSTNTGNLTFMFRLRDMIFTDPVPDGKGGQDNFLELLVYSGFSGFFPLTAYTLSTTQSQGTEVLTSIDTIDSAAGRFEFFTFLTDPDGTTFMAFETTATSYKTGKFFSMEQSTTQGGDSKLNSFGFDGVAAPDTGALPVPPVPLPPAALALLAGLGVLRIAGKRSLAWMR